MAIVKYISSKPAVVGAILAALAIALGSCAPPAEKAAGYLADGRLLFKSGDVMSAQLELRSAIQLEPNNAEARYLLAVINEQFGNYDKVLGDLQIAVESDPNFVDARVMLGNYYSFGGFAKQAKEQADAAIKLAPGRDDVRLLNARAWYLAGNRAKALGETTTALSLNPARRESISFAAALHAESGDIQASLATIDQGIKDVERDDVEALRRARIALLRFAGQSDDVESELRKMGRAYPDSPAYHIALVRLLVDSGRADEAELVFRDLVERDPDNAKWRIQLAGLLVKLDKTKDAETALKNAIAENPKSTTLRLALGGFYELAGRPDDAARAYTNVAENRPRSDDGLAARNRIAALNIGIDNEKSRVLFNEILRDAPDNVEALLYRAAFSFQRDRPNEAIADLQIALANQPTSKRGLLLLARSHLRAGDAAQAENTYRALLTLSPEHRVAANELAVLLGNRGDTEEAEALLRQTLQAAPGDTGASRNLVKALLMQQDFASAAAEAQRIIGLGESSGVAEYQLAEALRAQADSDRAIAAYQESLRKNPGAAEPLNRLIELLVTTGRTAEAVAYLEMHRADHPDDIAAALLLSDVYRRAGRNDDVRAILDNIISRRPDIVGAYIGLAALHTEASNERVAILSKGLKHNPGDERLSIALGSTHKRRQEYEKAIAVYEQVMRQENSSDYIANNLTSLLLDYRTDIESYQRALQIASRFSQADSHPISLGVLGWAHYRNNQYGQAVFYLERAVAGAGQNPLLRYYLGMAYFRDGNTVGAQQELQNAIEQANAAGATFVGFSEAEEVLISLRAAG